MYKIVLLPDVYYLGIFDSRIQTVRIGVNKPEKSKISGFFRALMVKSC